MLLAALARNWWALLLRGICAMLFGVMALAWPGITLSILIFLFGFYALFDGIAAIVLGIGAATGTAGTAGGRRWWEMVLVGILAVIAGIMAFAWPGETAVILLFIIAISSIVRGVMEIVAAIRLRRVIEREWLLGLAGVVSIAFGLLLLARPGAGAMAVIWIIGWYAVVFGVIEIALSFRLRGLRSQIDSGSHGFGGPVVPA
jgi:uncharacterized membrane protein HdeD (DUF308 family)